MKKNKKISQELFDVYAEYKEAKTKENLTTYNQLVTSALFKNNLGFQSELYLRFLDLLNEAMNKKYDIVFEKFVVTFNLNLKFSQTVMVPMISNVESSNTEAVNFKDSTKSDTYNQFLLDLNEEIAKALNAGHYVEIIPEILIYISPNTNEIKLLFSENIVVPLTETK
ncbi:DUF2714 domain-containing protein [Mycoplasma enhydrae]|uniref:DUF2714 domain-containing protein n=1 Tax=Mycoplasma enhydrae TaxID=2499220 RepID=UPI00197BFAA7|nr:DUF2714 domain-containing protein [Mycoplasma enhydrae]MBN4089647.1 DUF2714 domain-containing protein [Mycoplasma enhydrae]MCV3733759.1 DUF2714 domain-containing protein [Mycoplasma enhydrae]MCV3753514.1 DUF2714 domain-containing protein [Mycoplasma enhydrae]